MAYALKPLNGVSIDDFLSYYGISVNKQEALNHAKNPFGYNNLVPVVLGKVRSLTGAFVLYCLSEAEYFANIPLYNQWYLVDVDELFRSGGTGMVRERFM